MLYQNNKIEMEISRIWDDTEPLSELLALFFNYAPEEIRKFHKAQKQFNENLPELANEIKKELIQMRDNNKYLKKIDSFVLECKEFIIPILFENSGFYRREKNRKPNRDQHMSLFCVYGITSCNCLFKHFNLLAFLLVLLSVFSTLLFLSRAFFLV